MRRKKGLSSGRMEEEWGGGVGGVSSERIQLSLVAVTSMSHRLCDCPNLLSLILSLSISVPLSLSVIIILTLQCLVMLSIRVCTLAALHCFIILGFVFFFFYPCNYVNNIHFNV